MAPQIKLPETQAKCTKWPFLTQLEYTEGPFWMSKADGQILCTRILKFKLFGSLVYSKTTKAKNDVTCAPSAPSAPKAPMD